MPTYLELANFMDVPVQALRLARPSDFTCKIEGCLNAAIVGNYRFCCYHNQKWYPVGKVTGNLLLGEEYLYTKSGKKLKYKCQCNSSRCSGIGYCDAGRFPFPNNKFHRQLWFNAMGWDILADNNELEINLKPSNHCIAYWHFPQHRRTKLSGGQWTLIGRSLPYFDEKTKTQYDILVPSNSIDDFIEETKGLSASSPKKLSFLHEEVPHYLLPKTMSTAVPPPPPVGRLPPPTEGLAIDSNLMISQDLHILPQSPSFSTISAVDATRVTESSTQIISQEAVEPTGASSSSSSSIIPSTRTVINPSSHVFNKQDKEPINSKRKEFAVDNSINEQILKKAKEESELLLNLRYAIVNKV